jgi:hypothetical protein
VNSTEPSQLYTGSCMHIPLLSVHSSYSRTSISGREMITRNAIRFQDKPARPAHSACETSQNAQKSSRLWAFSGLRMSRVSKFDCISFHFISCHVIFPHIHSSCFVFFYVFISPLYSHAGQLSILQGLRSGEVNFSAPQGGEGHSQQL